MKKTILFYPILLLITAMLFSGCLVTSIHPLGTEEDIVFDEKLEGMWSDVDYKESWIFLNGEKNTYKLSIATDDGRGEFIAKLVKLRDKLFLDIYPERLDTGNIVSDVLMLPTHTFLSYSLDGDELSLGFTDPEWFSKRIDRNEDIGIEYEITEDDVLTLTASTEELQSFYLKHADDDEFFDLDDEKLHRDPQSAETIAYLKFEQEWIRRNKQKITLEQKEKAYEELMKSMANLKAIKNNSRSSQQSIKQSLKRLERQKIALEQEIQALKNPIPPPEPPERLKPLVDPQQPRKIYDPKKTIPEVFEEKDE
ncbi:hypothetical protein ACFL6P_03900 [Candidatus Latescibacterota bacterium]